MDQFRESTAVREHHFVEDQFSYDESAFSHIITELAFPMDHFWESTAVREDHFVEDHLSNELCGSLWKDELAFPVDHFGESTAVRERSLHGESLFIWRISFCGSPVWGLAVVWLCKGSVHFPEHFLSDDFHISAADLFSCESARLFFWVCFARLTTTLDQLQICSFLVRLTDVFARLTTTLLVWICFCKIDYYSSAASRDSLLCFCCGSVFARLITTLLLQVSFCKILYPASAANRDWLLPFCFLRD